MRKIVLEKMDLWSSADWRIMKLSVRRCNTSLVYYLLWRWKYYHSRTRARSQNTDKEKFYLPATSVLPHTRLGLATPGEQLGITFLPEIIISSGFFIIYILEEREELVRRPARGGKPAFMTPTCRDKSRRSFKSEYGELREAVHLQTYTIHDVHQLF